MRAAVPVALASALAAAVGFAAGWRWSGPDAAGRWRAEVERAAREARVDPDLLAALLEVESRGDPEAVSRAGAVGLLQLMPATAEEEARRTGLPWGGPDSLRDPRTNLRLGASYLARLLARFDGEEAFAVAAYNAGPERVRRWRRRAADADARTAVLREGFEETRRHVARVLALRAGSGP